MIGVFVVQILRFNLYFILLNKKWKYVHVEFGKQKSTRLKNWTYPSVVKVKLARIKFSSSVQLLRASLSRPMSNAGCDITTTK